MTKKDVKPLQWFLDRTRAQANAYARERDENDPCISCGRLVNSSGLPLTWNGGHYRSAGNNPAIRFHPLNIHKQCVRCNQYYGGNHNGDGGGVGYTVGITNKLGADIVAWLNQDHGRADWTREELEHLYDWFRKERKKLAAKKMSAC